MTSCEESVTWEDLGVAVGVPASGSAAASAAASLSLSEMMAEAGLSSLDCWDYSLELECLREPSGRTFACICS